MTGFVATLRHIDAITRVTRRSSGLHVTKIAQARRALFRACVLREIGLLDSETSLYSIGASEREAAPQQQRAGCSDETYASVHDDARAPGNVPPLLCTRQPEGEVDLRE